MAKTDSPIRGNGHQQPGRRARSLRHGDDIVADQMERHRETLEEMRIAQAEVTKQAREVSKLLHQLIDLLGGKRRR